MRRRSFGAIVLVVLHHIHFSTCTPKCLADLQEKYSHCYVKGSQVDFTCVYNQKNSDMTKASIMISTIHGGKSYNLNRTILGTNTIQGRIQSIGLEHEGDVACYYENEKCDCSREGLFAEFFTCSLKLFSERRPQCPVDFGCHISHDDSLLKCLWKSDSSSCWKLHYTRAGDSNAITCETDDDCPGPGPAYNYQILQRFCVIDNSTLVERHAFCPIKNNSYTSDRVDFYVTSEKFEYEVSRVYSFNMNERRVKLRTPNNVSINHIDSTSLDISWVSSCLSGFRVRCEIKQNTTEETVTKFVTSELCTDSLIVGVEGNITDLRPFTYYDLSLSCSVDGGNIWSDTAKLTIKTNESEPLMGPIINSHLFQTYKCNSSKECLVLYWKDQAGDVNNGIITGYRVEVREEEIGTWSESNGDSQSAVVEISDVPIQTLNVSVWSVNKAGMSLNASKATINNDKSVPAISCVTAVRDPWYDPSSQTFKVSWKTSLPLLETSTNVRVIYYYCSGNVINQETIHCYQNLDWIESNTTNENMKINVPDTSLDSHINWHFGVGLIVNGKSRGIKWDISRCERVTFVKPDQKNTPYFVYAIVLPIALIIVILLILSLRKVIRYQRQKLKIKIPDIPLEPLNGYTEVRGHTSVYSYESEERDVDTKIKTVLGDSEHSSGAKCEERDSDTKMKTVFGDSDHPSGTKNEVDSSLNFSDIISSSSSSEISEYCVANNTMCIEYDHNRLYESQKQESSGYSSNRSDLGKNRTEKHILCERTIPKEVEVNEQTVSKHEYCRTKEVTECELKEETVPKVSYQLPVPLNTDYETSLSGYVSHTALGNDSFVEREVHTSVTINDTLFIITENYLVPDDSSSQTGPLRTSSQCNEYSGSVDGGSQTASDNVPEYVQSTIRGIDSDSEGVHQEIKKSLEGEKERQERERTQITNSYLVPDSSGQTSFLRTSSQCNEYSGSVDIVSHTALVNVPEYVQSTIRGIDSDSEDTNQEIKMSLEGEKERQERERTQRTFETSYSPKTS